MSENWGYHPQAAEEMEEAIAVYARQLGVRDTVVMGALSAHRDHWLRSNSSSVYTTRGSNRAIYALTPGEFQSRFPAAAGLPSFAEIFTRPNDDVAPRTLVVDETTLEDYPKDDVPLSSEAWGLARTRANSGDG